MTRRSALLAAAMAAGTATQFVLGALAPRFAGELGLGPGGLGLVLSAMFAVGALTAGPAGRLVDRVGAAASLAATGAAAALAIGALAVASDRRWLIATVLGGGLAMALVNPGTNLAIRRLVGGSARSRTVGWVQAGVQAGALAAGVLAAGADLLGGWRPAAVVAATATGVVGVLCSRLPSPPDVAAAAAVMTERESRGVRSVALYAVLMSVASGAVFAHLALYATRDVGLPAAAAGALPAVFGAVGATTRVVLGRIIDRFADPSRLLVIMSLGAAVAVASIAAADTVGPFTVWPGAVLFGATGVAWPAAAMALVVGSVRAPALGAASGTVSRGLFAGLMLAPALGGWLAERTGSYLLTWTAVALTLVGAAAWASTGVRSRLRVGGSASDDGGDRRLPISRIP